MVVNGLSKSSLKLLLLAPILLTASHWWPLRVVCSHQMYFVLFPYDTNEMTGLLAVFHVAEIDLKSLPVTQLLTVFDGRYWSLTKLHSCFYMVVYVFDEISNLVRTEKTTNNYMETRLEVGQ